MLSLLLMWTALAGSDCDQGLTPWKAWERMDTTFRPTTDTAVDVIAELEASAVCEVVDTDMLARAYLEAASIVMACELDEECGGQTVDEAAALAMVAPWLRRAIEVASSVSPDTDGLVYEHWLAIRESSIRVAVVTSPELLFDGRAYPAGTSVSVVPGRHYLQRFGPRGLGTADLLLVEGAMSVLPSSRGLRWGGVIGGGLMAVGGAVLLVLAHEEARTAYASNESQDLILARTRPMLGVGVAAVTLGAATLGWSALYTPKSGVHVGATVHW